MHILTHEVSRPVGSAAGAARSYATYATVFLVVTLLSGVWLRGVFVVPQVIGGFRFGNALHAHSHVAFFGWTTMALFAVLAARLRNGQAMAGLRVHAHLVGVASALAFVGFLQSGYAVPTIALSVVHVMLWIAFAFAVWPRLGGLEPLQRRFWRGALAFLVVAGLGAMTPGVVMARQIGDPWLNQISIKSFLTPFTSGWLVLGVMGAVYATVERRRLAIPTFWLVVAGTLPSALFHTTAAPPAEWMTLVGRAGTALVGLGALLFATDVLRSRSVAPLLRLVGAAAAAKGAGEVLVSAGVLLELVASRQITIAYLHLLLLGMITPALAATALGVASAPRRAGAYAGGLALMLGALGALGWPVLGTALLGIGIDATILFRLALLGGGICAVAGIGLVAGSTVWPAWSPVLPHPVRRAATRTSGASTA